MLKLIRPYLKGSILVCALLAPIAMFFEVYMDLLMPTLMSDIVDIGIANGDLGYVMSTGRRMLVFAVIGLITGGLCGVLAIYAGVKMGGRMRTSLFAKIQSLSFSELDGLKTGSLITRLTNDVMQVQNMFMTLLRGLVRSPLMFMGGIFMSFILSPQLALVFCVVLPLLATFIFVIMSKTVPLFARVQSRIDNINTMMRENLLGVRVVKSFSLEQKQFSRFNGVNTDLAESGIKAQSTMFFLMPIVMLVMNLGVAALLWFGGNMEINGMLEAGKIMAMVNYMIRITHALMFLVGMAVGIPRARASAARIAEVFAQKPSVTDSGETKEPENYDIEFSDVSFGYGQGGTVLDNISFEIKQGRRVGIIGSTGCGKSTLVSLIPRLYDVGSGSVRIGGIDVRDIPLSLLRKKVGVVLQDSILFSGSVRENMICGDSNAEDAGISESLSVAEAYDFINSLPDGMDSHVEQRGKNFSGGQKQRLNIARTLLKRPEILIMDDSTSAVDLVTEARIHRAINRFMAGKTVIMIAQRVSSIMDCDIILVLDQTGRLDAQGNHESLMESSLLYRSIVVSQLGEEVAANG